VHILGAPRGVLSCEMCNNSKNMLGRSYVDNGYLFFYIFKTKTIKHDLLIAHVEKGDKISQTYSSIFHKTREKGDGKKHLIFYPYCLFHQ